MIFEPQHVFRYPSKSNIPKNDKRMIMFDPIMSPMVISRFPLHNHQDNHKYLGADVKVIRRMTLADITLKPINSMIFSMALIV